MRIRTQCLLLIVPLFLTLSVSFSVLINYWADGETLRELREEAKTLVLTVAEFISEEDFAKLASGKMGQDAQKNFFKPFHKVMKLNMARRLFAFAPGGRNNIFDLGPQASNSSDHALPADLFKILQQKKVVAYNLKNHGEWGNVMQAFAPITGTQGIPVGILGMHMDTSSFYEKKKEAE